MIPHAPRKLTAEAVQEIREAARLRDELRSRANRLSNESLAERYGTHQRNIEKILSYETWRWLK